MPTEKERRPSDRPSEWEQDLLQTISRQNRSIHGLEISIIVAVITFLVIMILMISS